jgi:hypothetical protein
MSGLAAGRRKEGGMARAWGVALVPVALSLAGCRAPAAPDAPRPSPVSSPSPPTAVPEMAGLVWAHSGGTPQPLPGFRFLVARHTAAFETEITVVTSDASGRYEIPPPHDGLFAFVIPADGGYQAPCPPGFPGIGLSTGLDVHVVPDAVLATTGLVATVPQMEFRISGTVTERTPEGTRPVAGAMVELSGEGEVRGLVRSVTLSNRDGNYLVCKNPPGTGTDTSTWVTARKDGYHSVSKPVFLGWEDTASFELVRQ